MQRSLISTWLFAIIALGVAGLLRPLPAATAGKTTLASLLQVQKSVQDSLGATQNALVALENRDGASSGVIVSADGLILTAAHVIGTHDRDPSPGQRLTVFLADGSTTTATSLGLDVATDAAMLRLDGKRTDWPFVPLIPSGEDVKVGEWCFCLGHPGGHDEARGPVLRMGKVLKVAPNNLQTDCVLMGGDSGGPLFNVRGELIGIHSRIWEGRDQNVHVSMAPFLRSWEAMRQSSVVRVWGQGAGGWLGVATRVTDAGVVEVDKVASNSPAERAGLRSGDCVLSLDKHPVTTQDEFSTTLKTRAAGDSVVLVLRNRSGERMVTVKLAKQPEE